MSGGAAQRWLERLRAHWWLTLGALLLVSPALGTGLVLDDHVLKMLSDGSDVPAGFHADPLFLFSFTSGRAEDNRELMDQGMLLPWWSDPQHRNAFFRPLSSLTHGLDFQLWPETPWLMHLHSLVWFAALLLVVAHVYRRLSTPPAWLAMLAFALFALDDAHGMTAAWIANRNALIAATLALPALGAHHRWLAHGFSPGAYLGPLCFALGLCAGETAVAVFGYLIAYTAVLDRARLLQRLLHLAPYVVLLVLWRVIFNALELGSAGSGAYHDPLREPWGFLVALCTHLPVLISAELALPLADAWFWGPPSVQLAIFILSLLVTLFFLGIGHVLLADDAEARFWMAGMLLSACAVAASVPGERLLLVPGIGGAALLARLMGRLLQDAQRSAPRLLLGALVLLHLVVAPFSLPLRAYALRVVGEVQERVDRAIPVTDAVAQKSVILVNAPFDVAVSYVQVARAASGIARPRHLYWLATASSPLTVQTLDAYTLRITPERGFLYSAPERHYRSDPSALEVGATVDLSDMRVHITEVRDGRPAAAEFRLREPLRAAHYQILYWKAGQLLPFSPPPPGRSVRLAQEDFFATLLRLGPLGALW